MSLPSFKVLRPKTIEEAVGLLAKHAGNIQIIAGGTDLIPSMKQGLFEPEFVLDLKLIDEMRGISERRGVETVIGALTPLSALADSEFIRRNFPVLYEAVRTVASPILRNMGTIGGNICLDTRCLWYNQSLTWRKSCGFCIKKTGDLCHVAPGGDKCWATFSGDLPPALLCLDADIEIANTQELRRVHLKDFYTNEGDARIKLLKDEMVTRIFLPEFNAGWNGVYRKLRVRGSIDYPLAGVAVSMKLHDSKRVFVDEARVAITAVNPAPQLVPGAEHALVGRVVDEHVAMVVAELAAKAAKPLTTSALTPEYRREMIRVYTKRAVIAAAENA